MTADTPDTGDTLEALWEGLLSRHPNQIRQAWTSLGPAEQQTVLAHLRRMASESGWHPEQKTSAAVALQVVEDQGIGD